MKKKTNWKRGFSKLLGREVYYTGRDRVRVQVSIKEKNAKKIDNHTNANRDKGQSADLLIEAGDRALRGRKG